MTLRQGSNYPILPTLIYTLQSTDESTCLVFSLGEKKIANSIVILFSVMYSKNVYSRIEKSERHITLLIKKTSIPTPSIILIFMEMNPWKFDQKQFTIHQFTKFQGFIPMKIGSVPIYLQCSVPLSEYLLFAKQSVWVLKIKVFGQKSTEVKWNYQIFCLHPVTVRQTLGIILVIKWFKNWSYQ